jgi:hypothetical protein
MLINIIDIQRRIGLADGAPFEHPDFLPHLEGTRSDVQLFGKQQEIDVFENFVAAMNAGDLPRSNQYLGELVRTSRDNLRRELDF